MLKDSPQSVSCSFYNREFYETFQKNWLLVLYKCKICSTVTALFRTVLEVCFLVIHIRSSICADKSHQGYLVCNSSTV